MPTIDMQLKYSRGHRFAQGAQAGLSRRYCSDGGAGPCLSALGLGCRDSFYYAYLHVLFHLSGLSASPSRSSVVAVFPKDLWKGMTH